MADQPGVLLIYDQAMTEDEFASRCTDEGWGEPRVVEYAADQRPGLHTHEFDAFVLLLEGSVTIESPDGDAILEPGMTCQVLAGQVHAENGGPSGGSGLLATRPATA